MPEPQRYRLYVATFSYAGNGGYQAEHPDVGRWLLELDRKLTRDPRIAEVVYGEHADTPISMARNHAVVTARKANCDLLLMIDSDMRPDVEPDGKPFWDTSFDFICEKWHQYPVVVGAPYCGPPQHEENVYAFRWSCCLTGNPDEVDMQLQPFTRFEAAMQSGIREVGALPTGLVLYDMRVFSDLMDPLPRYRELRELGLTEAEASRAVTHYFDYEWKSPYADEKASTEDVQNTRDISLAGIQKYGRNPVFCNWDAWAGHWKPKLVRKPQILTADSVSETLAAVVRRGNESGVKIERVNFRQSVLGDASDWQAVGAMRVAAPITQASDHQPPSSANRLSSESPKTVQVY